MQANAKTSVEEFPFAAQGTVPLAQVDSLYVVLRLSCPYHSSLMLGSFTNQVLAILDLLRYWKETSLLGGYPGVVH